MEEHRHIVETILIPHTAFMLARKRLEQCIRMAEGASEPVAVAVVGESRTGKSRVLKALVRQYPPTRNEEGAKIPVLRVTTPAKPTVRALQSAILRALGDPLHDRGTEANLTPRVYKLAKSAGVKALALEEFQHFYDKASSKVWTHAADWLKTFIDSTGIALIVVGLERCQHVINSNEQLAGRFLATAHMPRLDWRKTNDRQEFLGIAKAFHTQMSRVFDMPDLGSAEMGFRLYCGCGGIIGYLAKILRQAVWNAIDDGKKKIGLAELDRAYLEAVIPENELISHLRPFAANFTTNANEDILAAAQRIGTAQEPREAPKPPRMSSGRMRSSAALRGVQ